MPYPVGFSHDLSIITDDNLPHLTNHPNSPRITHWGPYEEVLQGSPLFINRHNVVTGTFSTREGYGVSRLAQEAIAHGAQYSWDTKARAPNTALLWRTLHDSDTVQGMSGSVLCLGRPLDPYARAVLFQNFEGPLAPSQNVQIARTETSPRFKGGFLLPTEVRDAEIITYDTTRPKQFLSVKKRSQVPPAMTQHTTL